MTRFKTNPKLLAASLAALVGTTLVIAVPAYAATRPNTYIHLGPSGTVSSHTAKFHVASTKPGYIQCKRDSRAWYRCLSSSSGYVTLTGLKSGKHTFKARGVTKSGLKDLTPAVRTWTVR